MMELIVSLGVFLIIAAAATPSWLDFMDRKRVEGVATELVSDLALMRAESAGKSNARLAVNLQVGAGGAKTCYSIFWSTGFDVTCDCRKAIGTACTSASRGWAELKSVNIPQKHGITLETAQSLSRFRDGRFFTPADHQIDVVGKSGAKLRVRVDGLGRVTLCSPGGSVGGYPSC